MRLLGIPGTRRSKKPRTNPRRTTRRLRLESLETRQMLSLSVPGLESCPEAPYTVYLDFDGHDVADWHGHVPGETPAFDTDGDPDSFSFSERQEMVWIFKHVEEDYSPFNVNVTTIDPGQDALDQGNGVQVVIGGDGMWYSARPEFGVAWPNEFTDSNEPTAFVFADNITGATRFQRIANLSKTVSHEVGHCFGLKHDVGGGPADMTPIMRQGYTTDRRGWWRSRLPDGSSQDDMDVLDKQLGYRSDDHSRTSGLGSLSGNAVLQGSGVIEKMTDRDMFSFYHPGGSLTIEVQVAGDYGRFTVPLLANLDARLSLCGRFATPWGRIIKPIVSADPATDLGASISTSLSAGTYYAQVASHGDYGDVGQYTITVSRGSSPAIGDKSLSSSFAPDASRLLGSTYVAADLAGVTQRSVPLIPSLDASGGAGSAFVDRNQAMTSDLAKTSKARPQLQPQQSKPSCQETQFRFAPQRIEHSTSTVKAVDYLMAHEAKESFGAADLLTDLLDVLVPDVAKESAGRPESR